MTESMQCDTLIVGPVRDDAITLTEGFERVVAIIPPESEGVAPPSADDQHRWHTYKTHLSAEGGHAACYRFSLTGYESLAAPTGLFTLYPGLETRANTGVETESFASALNELALSADEIEQVIIEHADRGLALFEAVAGADDWRDDLRVWVRTSPFALYDGMANHAELVEAAAAVGFDPLEVRGSDPDFFLQGFRRQPHYRALKAAEQARDAAKADVEKSQAALEDAAKARDDLQAAVEARDRQLVTAQQTIDQRDQQLASVEQTVNTRDEQLASVEQTLAEVRETLSAREDALKAAEQARDAARAEAEKTQAALKHAEDGVESRDAMIQQLRESLTAQTQAAERANDRLEKLESRMDQLFADQKTYIQQTSNALGQHMTRTARDQIDTAAVQAGLNNGQLPPQSNMDAALARALLERLEARRHDVILTFGSPDVTEFLCKALMASGSGKAGDDRRLAYDSSASETTVAPSDQDLPQRIMAFEHQRRRREALAERLAAKGLDLLARVQYTPWVEAGAPSSGGLFYACGDDLGRLRHWIADASRVLVVVGTPLAEAAHGRSAALRALIEGLPTQSIDLLIERDGYACESGLTDEWQSLLTARERVFEWLPLRGGIALAVSE